MLSTLKSMQGHRVLSFFSTKRKPAPTSEDVGRRGTWRCILPWKFHWCGNEGLQGEIFRFEMLGRCYWLTDEVRGNLLGCSGLFSPFPVWLFIYKRTLELLTEVFGVSPQFLEHVVSGGKDTHQILNIIFVLQPGGRVLWWIQFFGYALFSIFGLFSLRCPSRTHRVMWDFQPILFWAI